MKKPNPGHKNEGGVAKITSAMLESAVLAAGANISEAQDILDILKDHEKPVVKPRAWHYRWVLRFLCGGHDSGVTTKVKTLGREMEIRSVPPDAVIAEAEAAVKAEGGWGAALFLVDRSSSNELAEWPLAEVTMPQNGTQSAGGRMP